MGTKIADKSLCCAYHWLLTLHSLKMTSNWLMNLNLSKRAFKCRKNPKMETNLGENHECQKIYQNANTADKP